MSAKEKLNTKHAQKVDLAAYSATRGKRDPAFKAAYDDATDSHNIARQLAKLREQSGLSQRELAQKLHTSQAAISRLERSDYEGHSISTLKKYLQALGASMTIRFHRSA